MTACWVTDIQSSRLRNTKRKGFFDGRQDAAHVDPIVSTTEATGTAESRGTASDKAKYSPEFGQLDGYRWMTGTWLSTLFAARRGSSVVLSGTLTLLSRFRDRHAYVRQRSTDLLERFHAWMS